MANLFEGIFHFFQVSSGVSPRFLFPPTDST